MKGYFNEVYFFLVCVLLFTLIKLEDENKHERTKISISDFHGNEKMKELIFCCNTM